MVAMFLSHPSPAAAQRCAKVRVAHPGIELVAYDIRARGVSCQTARPVLRRFQQERIDDFEGCAVVSQQPGGVCPVTFRGRRWVCSMNEGGRPACWRETDTSIRIRFRSRDLTY